MLIHKGSRGVQGVSYIHFLPPVPLHSHLRESRWWGYEVDWASCGLISHHGSRTSSGPRANTLRSASFRVWPTGLFYVWALWRGDGQGGPARMLWLLPSRGSSERAHESRGLAYHADPCAASNVALACCKLQLALAQLLIRAGPWPLGS